MPTFQIKDGKIREMSDAELMAEYRAWMRVVYFLFALSVVFGPVAGFVRTLFDPGFEPAYVGSFVVANAVTTAIMIWYRFLITGGDATGVAALIFTGVWLVMGFLGFFGIEWTARFVWPEFEIPFFWGLVGIWPLFVNWRNAIYLRIV